MKTIGEIPCITAAGTPYQIGYAHGSGAKERIAVSLATYREMFWDYSGISWEQTQKIAESFVPCIENYNPDYLAEMQGIADGAGVGKFWRLMCAASWCCRADRLYQTAAPRLRSHRSAPRVGLR